MKIFYGSIRKRIVVLVLLAVAPAYLVLLSTELLNRQYAVSKGIEEAKNRLSAIVEVQLRITDSTATLLRTVASMTEIRTGEVEPARRILETLLATNPIYSNVILVDNNGDVTAAGRNHDKAKNLNFSDRKQFIDAVTSKGFAAGEYVIGKETGKAIFPFGMAVLDDQGAVSGVLIIGVRLDHYSELAKRIELPESDILGISDINGIRLFRYPPSDRAKIGDPVNKDVYRALSESPVHGGTIETLSQTGQELLLVYHPLLVDGIDAPYMYMIIAAKYDVVMEKATGIIYRLLFIGMASLLATLLIAWFLGGRGIAAQFEKLRKITGQFGSGQGVTLSGIDYNDGEVGDLAQSFDAMFQLLQQRENERNAALEQVRFSEKRLSGIIEGVDAIAIQGYDENHQVTFWNKASESLYGYSNEEAYGRKLEDLIIPEPMREEVERFITQWLEGGEEIPAGELVLVDKDGNDVPVFSSHVLTETAVGKEMFCIDLDLRPLKQSEKDREELLNRLRQSQKMEAIGTLAGGIAHDFNNILAPVIGYAELLLFNGEQDGMDEETREGLQQIHDSALRAKQLVRQILTFSRQKSTEFTNVQVQAIIREVVKLLVSTFPRNIEIRQDIDQDCPEILADPTQLHQVIMNIATNAFHAMGEDGGELSIGLQRMEVEQKEAERIGLNTSGQYICLTINDSGVGMAPEVLEKIFDPFFTTKEVGKGTGMGLSVVHGIVEKMDGAIVVDSELGHGSRFSLYFPVASEGNVVEDGETIPDHSFSAMRGAETILHVDDEEPVLRIIRRALTPLGYTVVSQASPKEAVELFGKTPDDFDLVLTDMSMPGMQGDELTSKISAIRPDIPVIISTGYSERLTPELIEKIGARDVVIKPVLLHELSAKIRSILDRRDSGTEAI